MANLADIFYGASAQTYNTYPPITGPAKFVSVAFEGIDVSQDGLYWTTSYVNTFGLRTLKSCIWDGSKFVATGELISGGSIQYNLMTSNDGYSWTNVSTTVGGISIAYNSGTYFIVSNVSSGGGGIILRKSTNGTTWTTQPTLTSPLIPGFPTPSSSYPYSVSNVTYSNGFYVISGTVIDNGYNLYACRWTSTNGTTWTPQLLTTDPSSSSAFDSIYTNSINSFRGTLPAGIKTIARIRNSLTTFNLFIEKPIFSFDSTTVSNPYQKVTIAKNGSTYVLSIQENIGYILYTNNDFASFNFATLPSTMNTISHVTFKDGFFYAVGTRANNKNRQEILKSSDGINWTSLSMFTTITTVPEHLVVR